MPYMAVGSRQILFNDTQAPAMARPEPPSSLPPVNKQASEGISEPERPVLPVQDEHLGKQVDVRA